MKFAHLRERGGGGSIRKLRHVTKKKHPFFIAGRFFFFVVVLCDHFGHTFSPFIFGFTTALSTNCQSTVGTSFFFGFRLVCVCVYFFGVFCYLVASCVQTRQFSWWLTASSSHT